MDKTLYALSELQKNIFTPIQLGTPKAERLTKASRCLMYEISTKKEWVEYKGTYGMTRAIKNMGKNAAKTIEKIFLDCMLTDNKPVERNG